MNPTEKIIREYLGPINFIKGKNYFPYYVKFVDSKETDEGINYIFRVDSEREPLTYTVRITIDNKCIKSATCTCPQFEIEGCCKHIAASLYHNQDELFPITEEERKLSLTKSILEDLYANRKIPKVGIRKQAHIEVILFFKGNMASVNLQIGADKLYSLNPKLSSFINAYKKGSSLMFGKAFTYNPDDYFFSFEDEKIIKYILEFDKRAYYTLRDFRLTGGDLVEFLEVLENKNFTVSVSVPSTSSDVSRTVKRTIKHIEKGAPIDAFLSKSGDLYSLKVDLQDDSYILTDDCIFVLSGDTIFLVPSELATVLLNLRQNEFDGLTFTEDYLEMFTGGMLPIIKHNIRVDESVEGEVVVGGDAVPKLYFDLKKEFINLDIKFDYNGEVVDYFEDASRVARDYEREADVVTELLNYGFKENDNMFYLDEIDEIGEFLENKLEELASRYEVFTSQKIKQTNFLKDARIRSTFAIGRDNILRYEFDFGSIKNDEIVDILESLKRKKKYYKLKNGDFLNLDVSEDLMELERLVEAMELSNSELRCGTGEIPKYRAVYLDSLKKDRYRIIDTNNLFDELIQKFNSFKDADVKFSKSDKEVLRDYQEVGVKWLYNIYKCGFGGILADEMGLGKSIQLICFIKEILKEKKDAKILIVAPTSLIYNWKNEFDKFGSEISYKVFAENKEVRIHDLENLEGINVLITTYGLVRRDKDVYDDIVFELVAIDEAQNIKNANAQMTKAVKGLHANAKVALTGTPLENSVLELWSIFDFIMPGYLASLINFQKKYSIKDVDEENMKVFDSLTRQINPFILRRRKKDVIKELPDKIENNIFIDLNMEQKKLYAAQLEKTKKEIDDIIKEEGYDAGNFKILQLLMKLRQLCIDPQILYENYRGGSAKIENLVSITKDIIQNGHKILLFTSFKTALDIVNREFTNNNISTYVIDGSVPSKKRMELVDKFNSDDTNVFLITLKSGGTGLNLTSADVVIHLDLWWNPQVENQATDRAHRIGQKNTVEVIKLICKGTIEERILELQNKKRILSDKLVDGEERDQNIISKLSEDDIKNLLSMDNEE